MKRRALGIAGAGLVAICATAAAADIDVMTQNQYVGTDLIGIIFAPSFGEGVINGLKERAASLPAERMKALAAEIGKRNPHLVSLQEVYKFGCIDSNPNDHKGCENQEIAGAFGDQLADVLAPLGKRYVAAATVIDVNLPSDLGPAFGGVPGIPVVYDGDVIYVTVMDRDVILARRGIPYSVAQFVTPQGYNLCAPNRESADGCRYQTVASVPVTIQVPTAPGADPVEITVPIAFERGYVGVDATVNGKPYRFVATHLETQLYGFHDPVTHAPGRWIQSAQAAELLNVLDRVRTVPGQKLLIAGDINSDPREENIGPSSTPPEPPPPADMPFLAVSPYRLIVGWGYTDTWAKFTSAPGLTCCQDADLLNKQSVLYDRYDMVFSKVVPKKVLDARLYGATQAEKTLPRPFGLWPSDHAAYGVLLTY